MGMRATPRDSGARRDPRSLGQSDVEGMTTEQLHDWLDAVIVRQMDELFETIAPGVEGMVTDDGVTIEIGGIRAVTPGSGAVSAYLDSLPNDRRVVVPYVTSEILTGMLTRRGFRMVQRFDPKVGGWGSVWCRRAHRE